MFLSGLEKSVCCTAWFFIHWTEPTHGKQPYTVHGVVSVLLFLSFGFCFPVHFRSFVILVPSPIYPQSVFFQSACHPHLSAVSNHPRCSHFHSLHFVFSTVPCRHLHYPKYVSDVLVLLVPSCVFFRRCFYKLLLPWQPFGFCQTSLTVILS